MHAPGLGAAEILADCRRQRTRALRWVAFTGALVVALAALTVLAAVDGRYHGLIVVLVPVLLVMNLFRFGQCVAAFGKIRRAEQIVRAAQPPLGNNGVSAG
jgi:hypothetical protein